jgi:hypothetical protein
MGICIVRTGGWVSAGADVCTIEPRLDIAALPESLARALSLALSFVISALRVLGPIQRKTVTHKPFNERELEVARANADSASSADIRASDTAANFLPDPPAAIYHYSPDRKAERPASHLTKFKGVVQVDGFPGFERLGANIRLAACWAHARRKFYEVHQATASPIAAEALRRIAELYAIETTIRLQAAAARQNVRQARSRPIVTAMRAWFETQVTHDCPAAAAPKPSGMR